MNIDPSVVERYALWLGSLGTARFGFRGRSQRHRLENAAKLLLDLDTERMNLVMEVNRLSDELDIANQLIDELESKELEQC